MVDQITENLYHKLIRSFPPTSSYSLADLAARNLRHDVLKYLSFVLEERATTEVESIMQTKNPWFDYSESRVNEKWTEYAVELKKHAIFPTDEWAGQLQDATESIVRYTMTPVRGLEEILFGDNSEIRSSTITSRLKRLESHPLVIEAVIRAASGFDASVTRAKFGEGVREHLTDVLRTISSTELEALIEPLEALVSDAASSESIPVNILVSFYDDLGFRDVADRIHDHAQRYNLTAMNADQFRDGLTLPQARLVESSSLEENVAQVDETVEYAAADERSEQVATDEPVAQTLEGLAENGDTTTFNTVATPVEESEPVALTGSSDLEEDGPEKPEPLWKSFQEKFNAPLTDRGARAPKPEESRSAKSHSSPTNSKDGNLDMFSEYVTAESPTVPIWERFRSRTTGGENTDGFGAAEVRVLGEPLLNRRNEVIQGLFGSSPENYHDVVLGLDKIPDWDGASIYIADEVFRKFNVNIYSELAVSFTNAVEQRYRAINSD